MRSLGRRAATAVLLGLPAALLAHALTFGGEHTLGGSLHAWALELGATCAFLAALIAAIAAVRCRYALAPRFDAIVGGAAAWFTVLELCEGGHGIPVVTAVFTLLAASCLVRCVLRAFAGTVAAFICGLRSTFAPARPFVAVRRPNLTPRASSLAHRLRLYSRPPPVFA